jgi:hypothetical protein
MKRFEVPAWVLLTVMTICLVVALWAVTHDELSGWIGF